MDAKAKKIVQRTFWTAQGWRSGPWVYSGDDFEYAKSKGLMFDPVTISHDEIVKELRELHRTITLEQVAGAFLHSLSTRKVHLRSVLSSWALTAPLAEHTYDEWSLDRAGYSLCGHCNAQHLMSDRDYNGADLNVLNFERIKWGGVRLNKLLYCWMDLKLFSREEQLMPALDDVKLLREMLRIIDECDPADSPRKLEKRWKDTFPSSRNERDVILEIWGYAGILAETDIPRKRRGGDSDFVSVDSWQGADGYSAEAVDALFGKYL